MISRILKEHGKVICGFFLVAVAVYISSLRNEFVWFDDNILIFENPAVQSFSLRSIAWSFTHFDPELYIPLTFFSYQLDHLIGGLNPTIFHLTSLILHAVNALLVYGLLTMRTEKKWIGILCGLLFLVHPLHTEAVAWAAARKDVLSTLFFLLSLITYLQYADSGRGRLKQISIGLFALGLLSKVSIVLLPGVLLLCDWYDEKLDRRAFKEKLPYAVIGVVFIIIALLGKKAVLSDSTMLEGVLMAAKSTIFYGSQMVWPAVLSVVYPYNDVIRASNPAFLWPVITLIIAGVVVVLSVRRTKIVTLGVGFFLITLAPSFTNYVKAGDFYFASDRYAYLPSVGILLILGWLMQRIQQQKIAVIVGTTLIIGVLALLAHDQSLVWKDTDTLFQHVLAHFDDSHLAHNKVGGARLDEGKLDEARVHFMRSIELKPTARAYYNLGVLALTTNDVAKAENYNRLALELNDDHVGALTNLGYIAYSKGNYEEALALLTRATTADPYATDALLSLAGVYITIGDTIHAREYLTRVVDIDPTNQDAVSLLSQLK